MADRKILFISKGEDRASTRYRALSYFSRLRDSGWTPSHREAPRRLSQWPGLLAAAREADVVVLLRRLFTAPGPALLRKAARRLVFDMDDAVFHGSGPTPSAGRARRFRSTVRRCDEVWAGNAYLMETAKAAGAPVCVLPTSIEPEAYGAEVDKPQDRIDLVWIGSSSTRRYLEGGLADLTAAASAAGSLALKIVADFSLTAGDDLPVQAVPWAADTEAEALACSHIGIAPMPDTPWTRGKCGCKVLQYMAAGLPVVASDVPIHRMLIADGKTGFIVSDAKGWQEALETLAADPLLRRAMGEAGRRRAVEHFSFDVTFVKMRERLDVLMAKK